MSSLRHDPVQRSDFAASPELRPSLLSDPGAPDQSIGLGSLLGSIRHDLPGRKSLTSWNHRVRPRVADLEVARSSRAGRANDLAGASLDARDPDPADDVQESRVLAYLVPNRGDVDHAQPHGARLVRRFEPPKGFRARAKRPSVRNRPVLVAQIWRTWPLQSRELGEPSEETLSDGSARQLLGC